MDSEITSKLEQMALSRTKPFCYGCYEEAPSGRCLQCGSDDLMRLLPGVGCEYGADWVVREILLQELTQIDTETEFTGDVDVGVDFRVVGIVVPVDYSRCKFEAFLYSALGINVTAFDSDSNSHISFMSFKSFYYNYH